MNYRKLSDKEYNLDYEIKFSIDNLAFFDVNQDYPPLFIENDDYRNVLYVCEPLQYFEYWFRLYYFALSEDSIQHYKDPFFIYQEFYLSTYEKERINIFTRIIKDLIFYVKNDRFRNVLANTFRDDPNRFNHFFSFVNPLVIKAVELLKQVDFWTSYDFQHSGQFDGFYPLISEHYAFIGCLFKMDQELNIYRPDNQQNNTLISKIETVELPHVYNKENARNLFEYLISNWNYDRDLRFSYLFNFLSENGYELPFKRDFETYIRTRFGFTGKFQYENANSKKVIDKLHELEKRFIEK